jgi:hypothetical protein
MESKTHQMTDSIISGTTQIALQPPAPAPKGRRAPAAAVVVPEARPPKKITDVELLQNHVELSRQFIQALQKQVKSLELEVARLQEYCRENNSCNVIVFGPPNDLSVAAITNNSSEGIDFCSRVTEQFERNAQQLHKRGISYSIIEDVPLNRMYDTPFMKTPTSGKALD